MQGETHESRPERTHPDHAPRNRVELRRWVRDVLEIRLKQSDPAAPNPGPLDYLATAYFEGREPETLSGPVPSTADESPDLVVWSCRGGGKTLLGAAATVLDLLFKPGIQVRILAGSVEQGSRMHDHLRRFFLHPDLMSRTRTRPTERRILLDNGSCAEVLAQSERSIRGIRVQKVRCDEVELFDDDIWSAAQLATRSQVCGGVGVRGAVEALSTMHIPGGLMTRLVEQCRDGYRRLFQWGLMDVLGRCDEGRICLPTLGQGPPAPASPGSRACATGRACPLWTECRGRAKHPEWQDGHIAIADAINMKHRVNEEVWESEMLCARPRRSELVVPQFEHAVHVVESEPPDPASAPLCGMDFGFRAPTVVLWGQVDAAGALWVIDERVRAGVILDEHAGAISESRWGRPCWVGVDPAGAAVNDQTGRSPIQVLQAAGLEVRRRQHGVQNGLNLLRARLKPADGSGPRIFIHARCRTLIHSLERYRYDPARPESLEPVKDGSDHAVDALRYLLVGLDAAHRTERAWYARI